ncbi:MAG TPA: hypothetical protein VHH90_04620 [Polyangia bacterium]|nr:hypothetical protein [Polyangia bacterium]HVZ88512.1 hypothetical protein [Polyangia bacterium]
MNRRSSFPALLFCAIVAIGGGLAYALHDSRTGGILIVCAAIAVALLVSSAIKEYREAPLGVDVSFARAIPR